MENALAETAFAFDALDIGAALDVHLIPAERPGNLLGCIAFLTEEIAICSFEKSDFQIGANKVPRYFAADCRSTVHGDRSLSQKSGKEENVFREKGAGMEVCLQPQSGLLGRPGAMGGMRRTRRSFIKL